MLHLQLHDGIFEYNPAVQLLKQACLFSANMQIGLSFVWGLCIFACHNLTFSLSFVIVRSGMLYSLVIVLLLA